MATTQKQYVVTSAATKTYAYGDIPTWDGTTIDDEDLLQVFVNGSVITLTTHYTVDDVNENVVFENDYPLAVGDVIVIKRVTDIDTPYVDFVNNSTIESADLDLAIGQNRFKIQELDTDLSNVLGLDTVNDCWDAESKKICNLASGTTSTDAVNLGQVTALIAGGDPMNVGDGIYAEADGDGSTTLFPLTDFPTTDVNAEKLGVYIDGVKQRPVADYSYALSASSVPTVTFVTAPPTGTNNIQFVSIPGVVTTTYAAASLDGDVIIDNTLDGAAVVDGTLDGDALIDKSVDVDKLDVGAGADDRFIVFNAAGDGTAQTITFDEITKTGPSIRTDITATELVEDTTVAENLSGAPTYTNSGSTTVFMVASVRAQTYGGTVTLTLDGESPVTMFSWTAPGGVVQDIPISFFVPPNAVVTFSSTGGTLQRIITQEV